MHKHPTHKNTSGFTLIELLKHKAIWEYCTKKEKEFNKTIKKQLSGIDLQQNRNMLKHNAIWE